MFVCCAADSFSKIFVLCATHPFFGPCRQVCRIFQFQVVFGARTVQTGDRRIHRQRWRFSQRPVVRLQPESVLHLQPVRNANKNQQVQINQHVTLRRDNDRSSLNCASMLKGGWWWKSCGRGLNGIYLTDPQDLTARQGTTIFFKSNSKIVRMNDHKLVRQVSSGSVGADGITHSNGPR